MLQPPASMSGDPISGPPQGMPNLLRRSAQGLIVTAKPWIYGRYPSALNGQRFRQRLFRSLIRAFDPEAIFESGTYGGASTHFLWTLSGRPIWTVEKNRGWAYCAKRRFRTIPEIRVLSGDSRAALRSLRDSNDFPASRALFYLDAHWEADLPLREEVDMITSRWADSIIVIDDFKVPDDSGYGFDAYGDDELSMDYLGSKAIGRYEAFWPNCPSGKESGARRGCVILVAPSVRSEVQGLPELRRIEGSRVNTSRPLPV